MRRVLALLALVAGAVAVSAPAAVADVRVPAGEWVAVQTASSGTLTPIAGTSRDYRLVLRGVAPTVQTFDDSPGTKAGGVAVRTLLDWLFHAGDGATHNAGITVGSKTMGVLLLGGRYDARTRTLSYRVRALHGGDRLPRHLRRPALFIDDIGASPGPAECFVIAHLGAQEAFSIQSSSLPAGGSWLQPPTLASPSYGFWKSVASSPDTACASEVVLHAGLNLVDLTATIDVSSTPSPGNAAGTVTCTLTGANAYMFACTAVLAQLSPEVRSASVSIS